MSTRRLPVLERVARDIADGDLASARSRLVCHLCSVGYKPELMARVARISADMRDPVDAGRFWLLADEDTPEAAAAIREFIRRAGSTASSVCAALPAFTRRAALSEYPERVRQRLAALGLDAAIMRRATAVRPGAPATWRACLAGACLVGLMLFGLASALVGACVIVIWSSSLISACVAQR